jgi:lysozyme
MRLSENGKNLIKGFEGLSLKAYPDPPGDPQKRHSIGYGHSGASPGDVITRQEADRLFDADIAKYELGVSLATPSTTQDQFDAFTSLAYNIGSAGFAKSTAAARHNMGDFAGAADAILMWNKAAGAVHPGLVKRREKERGIYLYGHSGAPWPVSPQTPTEPIPLVQYPQTEPAGPAPSSLAAGGIGVLIAGVGLVFFCPVCSANAHVVGVSLKPPSFAEGE